MVDVLRDEIEVPPHGDALARAVADAPAGSRLRLLPGVHTAGLALTRSLALLGGEGVVLRAPPRLPVLWLEEPGLLLHLQGLVLTGGAMGGLRVLGGGRVQAEACTFERNHARLVGGGGLYARAGWLTFSHCHWRNNEAPAGGALLVEGEARVELQACDLVDNRAGQGSALAIADGATLTCRRGSWRDHAGIACFVAASRQRRPSLQLQHLRVDGGDLVVRGCTVAVQGGQLPASWRQAGIDDQGGVRFEPA
jgi:hypothetical protein